MSSTINIALSTVIIFFLFVVPGLLFRRFYYTAEFSKEYFKTSPFEVLVSALIPGFLLQVFWMLMIEYYGYTIDLEKVGQFLLGVESKNIPNKNPFVYIRKDLINILCYNISLWIMSGAVGYALKILVRKTKRDRKYEMLRFKNNWHYILRGEILDFPKIAGSAKNINTTYVDALVNIEGKSVLYTGLLEDYQLTREGGGLECIYISETKRKYVGHDGESLMSKEHEVKGRFMIIPMQNIINLNVSYVAFDKPKDLVRKVIRFIIWSLIVAALIYFGYFFRFYILNVL